MPVHARSRTTRTHRPARRLGALLFSGLVAVFVVGLTAITAFAAVTCAESAGTLTVTMSANNDSTTISINPANTISVTDGATPVVCTGSTSTGTVMTIQINGTNAGTQTVTINQAGAEPLPDGITNSIVLDLGEGGGDPDVLRT